MSGIRVLVVSALLALAVVAAAANPHNIVRVAGEAVPVAAATTCDVLYGEALPACMPDWVATVIRPGEYCAVSERGDVRCDRLVDSEGTVSDVTR